MSEYSPNIPNNPYSNSQSPSNMIPSESTRGRSVSWNSSITSGRSASDESILSKSLVDCAERMEAQSWANQMEVEDPLADPATQSPLESQNTAQSSTPPTGTLKVNVPCGNLRLTHSRSFPYLA